MGVFCLSKFVDRIYVFSDTNKVQNIQIDWNYSTYTSKKRGDIVFKRAFKAVEIQIF